MLENNPNKIIEVFKNGYPYFHLYDENGQPFHSANRYADHLFDKGIRYNTIKPHILTISHYAWFCQLSGIQYDDLNNFRNRFDDIIADYMALLKKPHKRNRSRRTIIKRIRILLEFFLYCARRRDDNDAINYIQSLLDEEYKLRPISPYEQMIPAWYEPITQNGFNKIQSECTNLRDRIILKLMHDTGIRQGELLTLRWQDLILEKNCIVINGAPNLVTKAFAKTGYREIVALNDIFRLLELYKDDLRNNGRLVSEYIFISLVGEPKVVSDSTIRRLLKTLSAKTAIYLHSHRFRKTCAYNMKILGIPLDVISVQLGHRYTTTTEKYYLGVPWDRKYREIISRDDEYMDGEGI